ncbi:pilus assembly protein [Luteibacter sp.]|uniref:pilus assembly protein n=1 Tax=Luteibacter sp. TaxID=1886636 RepID=UPI003F80B77D
MSASQRSLSFLVAFALAATGGYTGMAAAKTTDLSTTPPDLTTSVAPNVAITFDDSGSMQSYYMGDNRPFDGGGWDSSKPWMCAGVIDPRAAAGTKLAQAMNGVYYNPNIKYTPPVYADGTSFPNAASNADGSFKSLNYVWFNGIDVNRKANAVIPNATGSTLSNRNSQGDAYDKRVDDMTGADKDTRWACTSGQKNPFDTKTVDAGDGKSKPNGGPYYWRLKSTASAVNTDKSMNTSVLYDSNNWEPVAVPADQYQNFANWFAYYRTRNMMTRTTLSQAFSKIGNSIRIAWQNMANQRDTGDSRNLDTRFGTTAVLMDIGAFDSSVRSDFYDWMFQVVGGNSTPARAATIRASNIFRQKLTKDANDPYWNGKTAAADTADLTCRKNFHMLVTDGYWNEGDPGLPGAGGSGAVAMSGSTNTATVSQTLPDGTAYNPSATTSAIYSNVAGGAYNSSMANIAWFFWATDAQPGLTDGVKPYWKDLTSATTVDPKNPGANPDVYWNPSNDPAKWQHISQFYVTLGVAGTLAYPDDYASLLAGTKQWPQPSNNSAPAVDDTWHGAINSRGGFFNASNPATLVNSLVSIINSVIATSTSAVSASLNTGVIGDNAVTYVPSFSSTDWSGTLQAYTINSAGVQGTLLWDAGKQLTERTDARMIATWNGTTGVDYQYSNLGATEAAIMNTSDGTGASGSADSLGLNRVNWVRGSRTDEGNLLRARSTLLGAIINAQPVYTSYPSSGYRDYFPPSADGTKAPETVAYTADATKSYSQYVSDNLKRVPTLWVAANDGMVHGFDAALAGAPSANPGRERWAYVPAASARNLQAFSKKENFAYAPTVDATPIYRDVYFSTGSTQGWHTILLGGLRLGGRGVYALDITNPAATSSADAASKVLWEFNSSTPGNANSAKGGARLGYTYGQPNVGRLSNGKWVVLVPAGYFPLDALNPDSKVPEASAVRTSLFVLDAQTGAILKEFRTPSTYGGATISSWGLSTPVLGDYNNDQIDDVAFAGDLAGNLWRFDLRNLSTGTVDLVYKPTDDSPAGTKALTNADQPITVMPRLFPDPTSQSFIVLFGTGKFIGSDDRTTTDAKTQSVYGVRDPGPGKTTGLPWTRSNLVQQVMVEDSAGNRGLTSNAVPTPTLVGGWYFDLNISGVLGERVVVTPTALFNTNRAIITTLIPTTADPCNPGRVGALLVIDATTGGAGAGVSGTGSFGSTSYSITGYRITNAPSNGTLPVATSAGGASGVIPGIGRGTSGSTSGAGLDMLIWRRRSWRILNDH